VVEEGNLLAKLSGIVFNIYKSRRMNGGDRRSRRKIQETKKGEGESRR
jgi:hypothetical protein